MDNSDTNRVVTKSTILSFKPRQVILLAQHNPCPNKETKIITQPTLNQSLLDYFYRNGFGKTVKRFQSEAQIQSDALKASPSPLRLEDIFCKYNACEADSNKSINNKPVLGKDEAQKTDKVSPTNEEKPTKKKKKKGTVESDNGVIENRPEVADKKNESSKSCAQLSEDTKVDEQETKPKKKKKTKHNLDSSADELEKPVDDTVNGLKIDDLTKNSKDKKKKSIEQDNLEASTTNEIELVTGVAEKERKKKKKKSSTESAEDEVNTVKTDIENEIKLVIEVAEKGRKKKKKKSSTESAEDEMNTVRTDIENEIKLVTEVADKGRKKKKKSSTVSAVNEDEVNTVKTGTENEIELVTEVAEKERKKNKKKKPSTDSAVNEDEVNTVKIVTENETLSKKEKRSSEKRKRSLSDDDENVKPITEMTVIEESKRQKTGISEENSKSEGNNAQETSNKLLDEQTNGKVKVNGGEMSSTLKSKKKKRNATAESKTVNAFQRVKIEQVEFAHEKLQDNSYWAKDGAEIGYGAKAQEVLGQVRGRDFRHEKTKKKCGTYTGGRIDLQSHSVKLSYCDEE
uniref:Putative LIS1 homology motif, SRP40 n=1 Tax=Tanacetum cinerariifolium TaxID=118510 RepID=A0A6L2JDE6_TANCI|nr:putative LIS1 homology motif, SRP40 [Tanacetum cinerariifolium]